MPLCSLGPPGAFGRGTRGISRLCFSPGLARGKVIANLRVSRPTQGSVIPNEVRNPSASRSCSFSSVGAPRRTYGCGFAHFVPRRACRAPSAVTIRSGSSSRPAAKGSRQGALSPLKRGLRGGTPHWFAFRCRKQVAGGTRGILRLSHVEKNVRPSS